MLVAGVNLAAPAELSQTHGVANQLEFVVVIETRGRGVTPLFFSHQQRESHVLVGVGRAVGSDTRSARTNLPVHQIVAAGIRHPLLRIPIESVKEGFVGHVRGNQHAVADTFRHGVVTVAGALYTVTISTVTAVDAHAAVRRKLRAPVGVVSLDPSAGHRHRRIAIVIQIACQGGVGAVGIGKLRRSSQRGNVIHLRGIGPGFQRHHHRHKEDHHPQKDGAAAKHNVTHFVSLW
jgi:hypothetical protein